MGRWGGGGAMKGERPPDHKIGEQCACRICGKVFTTTATTLAEYALQQHMESPIHAMRQTILQGAKELLTANDDFKLESLRDVYLKVGQTNLPLR